MSFDPGARAASETHIVPAQRFPTCQAFDIPRDMHPRRQSDLLFSGRESNVDSTARNRKGEVMSEGGSTAGRKCGLTDCGRVDFYPLLRLESVKDVSKSA